MKDRIRRLLEIIIVAAVLILVFTVFESSQTTGRDSMDYYLANFMQDTGAENAVAAIYLNYRVFDTLFEALLLMVSVTGIIYFLEEKGREDTE